MFISYEYSLAYADPKFWHNKYSINELENIIENEYLTEEDWNVLSISQKLTPNFILNHENEISFSDLSLNENLTDDIIEAYEDLLDWDNIALIHPLTIEFVDKWGYKLRVNKLVCNKTFTVDILDAMKHYIDWNELSYEDYLTEDIIRKFHTYVNWDILIKGNRLFSESFIREFIDYFDLNSLVYRVLPFQGYENLMRELKNKIDWEKYKDEYYSIFEAHRELYNWWLNNKRKTI